MKRYFHRPLLLLLALSGLAGLTACNPAPDKERVAEMVRKYELKRNINAALKEDLDVVAQENEAKIAGSMEEIEVGAEALSMLFGGSGGFLSNLIERSKEEQKEKEARRIQQRTDSLAAHLDGAKAFCQQLADNWDFTYKSDYKGSIMFLPVYQDSVEGHTERALDEALSMLSTREVAMRYIAALVPDTPDLSDLEKVRKNRWTTTDLDTGRQYLVKRTDNGKITVQRFKNKSTNH